MVTVLTLKNGMVRFQISQLMWTIVTICMVVFQCKFLATNVLNGLFWFSFPMATVVMNDISAYFCGITWGRKFIQAPFLALSPNKTWEGFLGAAVCTTIFAFFFPVLMAKSTWFTCPVHDLYIWQLPPPLTCEVNPTFLPKEYVLPEAISLGIAASMRFATHIFTPLWSFLGITAASSDASLYAVTLLPIQLHGLAYGLFASFIAPFGGFLASAIKRAYKLKDFDAFLPGTAYRLVDIVSECCRSRRHDGSHGLCPGDDLLHFVSLSHVHPTKNSLGWRNVVHDSVAVATRTTSAVCRGTWSLCPSPRSSDGHVCIVAAVERRSSVRKESNNRNRQQ